MPRLARFTVTRGHQALGLSPAPSRDAPQPAARSAFVPPQSGGANEPAKAGVMDGAIVTVGVLGQNAIVRYVPNLVPATMTGAATINALLKDVLGIVAGAYGAASLVGTDRAKFLVAGQVHAAIARQLRANNVPVVGTLLGEYDPVRLGGVRCNGSGMGCPGMGDYARGFMPAGTPTGRIPLPRARASNVRTLANVGIYSDGVAFSPSMF